MRALFATIAFLYVVSGEAQNQTVRYGESQEDFLNPERGFYLPSQTTVSRFRPLDPAVLAAYRTRDQRPGKASYSVRVSLLLRSYELDGLTKDSLPASFLRQLQQDFDLIRSAGLKMILRFAYTNKTQAGNCPDEYRICPPYGDAAPPVVLKHIAQLKPLLRANADIIAVWQEGFIGVWGEGYYSDYFGDASANGSGTIADSNWRKRNQVLQAELDALPADRMVQVRTPQLKQKFLYGPGAAPDSPPLEPVTAFNRSFAARIAFHDDCFLASPDDYGTYSDAGSSTQPRGNPTEVFRRYIAADTKYTAVGGETCDDAFSPQNDCAPAGDATGELRRMHYSFLNAAYNVQVTNDWDSAGCMASVKRELGYRFSLQESLFPRVADRARPFVFTLRLTNSGYASPFNPRPVKLVFRDKDKNEFALTLPVDLQRWFPGQHDLSVSVYLAQLLPAGLYSLFLSLPDAAPALTARPAYAIRFANENTWEASTGYNDLKVQVRLK